MVWLLIFVVVLVVLSNALILLRTAKKPKIPGSFKLKPYEDDNGNGW